MCTITIIPWPKERRGGFRLACNRDELRERAPATPPRVRQVGDRLGAFPLDPDGGGTWVGVNDAGLALALLNLNSALAPRPAAPRSRGAIIPYLLECDTLSEAARRAREIEIGDFGPFRLIMIDGAECLEVCSDVRRLTERLIRWDGGRPVMFTSSGLGDLVVEPPRCELFETTLGHAPGATPAAQDAFHRHRWPDRLEMSVCMSRADARTVSITVVEVNCRAGRASVHYLAIDDREAGHPAAAVELHVRRLTGSLR